MDELPDQGPGPLPLRLLKLATAMFAGPDTGRWCNGSVVMFGDSYYGFTQWAAAASGHRALKAIVPRSTTTEIGTDWMYRGSPTVVGDRRHPRGIEGVTCG